SFGDPILLASRRTAKECVELSASHRKPGAVIKVRHVKAKRAILLEVEKVLQNCVVISRLTVGRETHQLIFARVDLEAGEVGECGVQQSKRVRKVHLP